MAGTARHPNIADPRVGGKRVSTRPPVAYSVAERLTPTRARGRMRAPHEADPVKLEGERPMATRTTPPRPRDTRRPLPVERTGLSPVVLGSLVAVLVAVVAVASAWGGYAAGKPDGPKQGSVEAIAAELGAEQKERAAAQATELLTTVKAAQQEYLPLLRDVATVLPVGGGAAGSAADAARLRGWQSTTSRLAGRFAAEPSGTTDYNVAYAAFSSASLQFDLALRTYAEAVGTSGTPRERLLGLATQQRDSAAKLWSAGAQQLDDVTIDAGLGHQHFFLPASGSEADIPQEMREHGDDGDGR